MGTTRDADVSLRGVVEHQCGRLRGLAHETRSHLDEREIGDRKLLRGWAELADGIAHELTLALAAPDADTASRLKGLGHFTANFLKNGAIVFAFANGAATAVDNYDFLIPDKVQELMTEITIGVSKVNHAAMLSGPRADDGPIDSQATDRDDVRVCPVVG